MGVLYNIGMCVFTLCVYVILMIIFIFLIVLNGMMISFIIFIVCILYRYVYLLYSMCMYRCVLYSSRDIKESGGVVGGFLMVLSPSARVENLGSFCWIWVEKSGAK